MKKEKKDVLFLLQYFYPEYISSAMLPFETATAFVKAGYSVDVICGQPDECLNFKDLPLKETVNGIGIQRLKYLALDKKSKIGRLVNYFSFTFATFLRLFKMRNYKTIFVYSNPPVLPLVAALASKLFGSKLVFIAYDLYPEIALKIGALNEGGIVSRVMKYINKKVYKRASAVVALSSEMKQFIKENRNISEDKIHIIPNWYESEQTAESEGNEFRKLANGRFTVSYFGNMGIAQDMETVINTIVSLKDDKDVCFLLAGHGNKYASVEERLKKENVSNAYFFKFLKGQEFCDALSVSDMAIVSLEKGLTGLCVPSKTYAYMMKGLALIAIMRESDIVADAKSGAGIYAKNGDYEFIVEKIKELKNDTEAINAMKKKCREIYLEKYTREIAISRYIDLI